MIESEAISPSQLWGNPMTGSQVKVKGTVVLANGSAKQSEKGHRVTTATLESGIHCELSTTGLRFEMSTLIPDLDILTVVGESIGIGQDGKIHLANCIPLQLIRPATAPDASFQFK